MAAFFWFNYAALSSVFRLNDNDFGRQRSKSATSWK